ncbi:ArnT family glycosyltransferase [Phytomonospora endophytica]|uniref:4-amino-4-deoxy-L-arabinose transferase-like glycosyltransferase n=1 Tax=Phytomonospora endophytica TaxID=714109 RepID=A0A841FK80_9ACTN|nr:glycosyltransferase family 39 protein [Phytomonospora endophytica]MBB6034238.1 4-amino-4-deoxy-L-arabinose transferase-like glycosyltransferase [Phytomonospora endophytica]
MTTSVADRPAPPPFAARPVLAVAAVLAVVLTALSGRYGFHRDELYFLAAGKHPAWGYVDQPPLTPMLARASTWIFGETPQGLRVTATLACALMVVLTALLAREFGGDRPQQTFAAVAAAVSGFVIAVGHMVSTSTFDLLLWLVLIWIAVRLLRGGDGRWWLAAGAVAGIGVLNKYLIALLVLALLAGILVTGPRRVLRGPWIVAGVAVAALIAAPNLWWQAAHDWPQLTVASGIGSDDGAENRIMFVPLQFLYLSPLLVPVWIAGLVRLWRAPTLRWARPVAVAYPVMFALTLAGGGKGYYVLPILLALTAAGAAPALAWVKNTGRRASLTAAVVVAGASSAVVSLPVLPPAALGAVNGINAEQGEQVGWRELAEATAEVWSRSKPPVVFTQNYGQAGAIARYGPELGLPEPYSGHMSFYDWGPPPDAAGGVVILRQKGGDTAAFAPFFTGCVLAATFDNGFGVDNEEQGAELWTCTGTTRPWSVIWPELRRYY